MNNELMFSSKTDNWSTPQEFFDKLNNEFGFTLDPCADDNNHKCEKYFTKEQDGLSQHWGGRRKNILQSTLRTRNWFMGKKMLLNKSNTREFNSNASSSKNRYKMVS